MGKCALHAPARCHEGEKGKGRDRAIRPAKAISTMAVADVLKNTRAKANPDAKIELSHKTREARKASPARERLVRFADLGLFHWRALTPETNRPSRRLFRGTTRFPRRRATLFASAQPFAPSTRRPCRVRASPPRRVVSRGPSRHGRSTTTIGRSSRRARSEAPPRTVEAPRTPGASR